MSQNPIAPLDPDTESGSELADRLVAYEQSVLTQHSGSSRPSYAQSGTLWLDTTTNPWLWKIYNGSTDIIIAAFSTGASGRHREGVAEASVASAATTDVLGSTSKFIYVTGSATITSFGSEPNQVKFVRAAAAATFTITHNATSLILPSSANITVTAGDSWIVLSDASGNARVYAYQRASGQPLVASAAAAAFPSGTIMMFRQTAAPTSWTKDTSNYNDHAIRVVTGTPSSGGSLNFSTVFAYTATASKTLVQANLPSYNLSIASLTATPSLSVGTTISNGGGVVRNLNNPDFATFSADAGGHNVFDGVSAETATLSLSSGTVSGTVTLGGTLPSGGSGTSFTVPIDTRVRYVDCIFATKD